MITLCMYRQCRRVLNIGDNMPPISHGICPGCMAKFLWLGGQDKEEIDEFMNRTAITELAIRQKGENQL